MKYYLIPVCLFFLFQIGIGQQDAILPGIVVEQNSAFRSSKGKVHYLSNVQIKAAGVSKLSDAKGKFTLVFADNPFGNVVRVFASRHGYEIVNEEELKKAAVLGRRSPLKVVMCAEGQLYENQVTYYKIAKDAALASYEEKVAILTKESREKEELIAEIQLEFGQEIKSLDQANKFLEQQRQSAESQARELADKFITVNLDDQSEAYQRAFRAFLSKDVERALMILDSVDLEQRLRTNAAERAKEEDIVKTFQESIAARETQMEQDINQSIFKARLHVLRYEFTEAAKMFELALQYDKANEELIFEVAVFFQNQNKFSKADTLYNEVLAKYRILANEDKSKYLPNVATTLNNLGNLLRAKKDMASAQSHYEEALSIRKTLAITASEVYEPYVAMTLNNLGALLSDKNEKDSAKVYFEKSLSKYRVLAKENPQTFLQNVAGTLNNLGALLSDKDEIDLAQLHYQEALSKYRDLTSEKQSSEHRGDLAMTLYNLGNLLSRKNKIDSAQVYYEEALLNYRVLAKKDSSKYESYVATTLQQLGSLLTNKNELDSAQWYLEEALSISRVLTKENQDAYLSETAAALNNLGVLWSKKNEKDSAQWYYENRS